MLQALLIKLQDNSGNPAWPTLATIFIILLALGLSMGFLFRNHPSQVPSRKLSLAAPERCKRLTLFIDDIPAEQSKELEHVLKSLAQKDSSLSPVVENLVKHTLVHRNAHTSCATVSFDAVMPTEVLIARLRKASQFQIDCNFYGITPIHQDPTDVHVDIVAVPGLASHALGSWKSRTTDKVWLRDFLPGDISNIRVLLYGYDTKLQDNDAKQSISHLANFFLENLAAFRAHDGTSRRPVIFIGHSLGGLLIKEALVSAQRGQYDEHKFDLYRYTYAMLFFGVPHLGLRNKSLKTIVHGKPNEGLVNDLVVDGEGEASHFLERLSEDFSKTCKGQYHVVNFFERKRSATVEVGPDGKPALTGEKDFLVLEKSATSSGLVAAADEDRVSFDTDHSGLVKYDERNQKEYIVVSSRLKGLVAKARVEVNQKIENRKQLNSESVMACLKSLAFTTMEYRTFNIKNALDGTCTWLLKHSTFSKWSCLDGGLLWIKGKPGSGKSTLVKYASRQMPAVKDKTVTAISFFFHGRGEEMQKTRLGLLRSLLHQLLSRFREEMSDLVHAFEEKKQTMGDWNWHPAELWELLGSSLPKFLDKRALVIFIDALDEAGEDEAVQLAEAFRSTKCQFLICFSCRHYPIMELKNALEICSEKENEHDIETYVQDRLETPQNPQLAKLSSTVIAQASGNFLWARLVVEQIKNMVRQAKPHKEIKDKIKSTPKELTKLYEELTKQMMEAPEAAKLVQLICVAMEPLSSGMVKWMMIMELNPECQSLKQCEKNNCLAEDDQIQKRIRSLSCGLLEVVSIDSREIVQFIHQTAKDFFLDGGLSGLESTGKPTETILKNANCRISRLCLRFLSMDETQQLALRIYNQEYEPLAWYVDEIREMTDPSSQGIKWEFFDKPPDFEIHGLLFTLIGYAGNWIAHAKLGEAAETSDEDLLKVFSGPTRILIGQVLSDLSWEPKKRYSIYDSREPEERGSAKPSRSRTTLLHHITAYSLSRPFEAILRNSDTAAIDFIRTKDVNGRTPFILAVQNGHELIIRRLLSTAETEIDFQDRSGRTALSWAAGGGNESIVKLLLGTGKPNINLADKRGHAPLYHATIKGHQAIAQLLLMHKADVNLKDNDSQTLLMVAAINGHQAIVQLLLDHRANVNPKDKRGWTSLFHAADRGHQAIAELLLKHGTNINWKDNHGRTPLFYTAIKGHQAIAQLLLDHRANVNPKDDDGWTPLSYAADKGHQAIAELLLKHGASMNSKDNHGQTPLSYTANKGHLVIAQLLLKHKADTDLKDNDGQTPLIMAANGGYLAIAQLLLEHKADADSKDNNGWTPLMMATSKGYLAITQQLLKHGADTNAKDNDGYTPLMIATNKGSVAFVQTLLGTGIADVHPTNCFGWTPLTCAAIDGNEAIVELLIQHGAEVDLQDRWGNTPLFLATRKGHENVITVLLKTKKADVHAKNRINWTPLSWAAAMAGEKSIKHGTREDGREEGTPSLSTQATADFLTLRAWFGEPCLEDKMKDTEKNNAILKLLQNATR